MNTSFSLISDTHFHTGYNDASGLDLPGGDVLLIAGDLCEVGTLKDKEILNNLRQELNKYKQVFSVMGNHEHYNGDLLTTKDLYESRLTDHVRLLEKEWVDLPNGDVLFGATLWSSLLGLDPLVEMQSRQWSDYRRITVGSRGLEAKDTYYEYNQTLRALHSCLEESRVRGKEVIVMTHFSPSSLSIPDKYRGSPSNPFYYSDLEDIILDNPHLKVWCHGHTHNHFNYKIGECRVLCNPHGYTHESGLGWDKDFKFERLNSSKEIQKRC